MKTAQTHQPETDLGIIPAVFDAAPIGVLVVRKEATVYANSALWMFLGYDDPEEFVGAPWYQHIAPDARPQVDRLLRHSRRPSEHACLALSRGGEEIPVRIHSTWVELSRGDQATLLFITEDAEGGWFCGGTPQEALLRFPVRQDLPEFGIEAGSEIVPHPDGGVRVTRMIRDQVTAQQVLEVVTGRTITPPIRRGHLKLVGD